MEGLFFLPLKSVGLAGWKASFRTQRRPPPHARTQLDDWSGMKIESAPEFVGVSVSSPLLYFFFTSLTCNSPTKAVTISHQGVKRRIALPDVLSRAVASLLNAGGPTCLAMTILSPLGISSRYYETKFNLGGFVTGQTRRRMDVTVSGVEVQVRSLL